MDLFHWCERTWNFWILETKNKKVYIDAVKFKTKKKIEHGRTFNLHRNSIYAKDAWSLHQFWTLFLFLRACVFSKSFFFFFYLNIQITTWAVILFNNSYWIINWLSNWTNLLGQLNWALLCGLEWDQRDK